MKKLLSALGPLLREAFAIYWTLLKIMVPVIIVVKVLRVFGGVDALGSLLAPMMGLVGLPGSMGLVFATALLTNLYGAMLALTALASQVPLTVAQGTVLTTMMLVAHALPVELRIAQKAGVRLRLVLVTRLVGAFLLGFLLHHSYRLSGWHQTPLVIRWQPAPPSDAWGPWLLHQGSSLIYILGIVIALLLLLRGLEAIGFTSLLRRLLRPLLRALGIGEKAIPITVVGLTLGVSFGGGLLIRESQLGRVDPKDVLFTMVLLGLCHSVIEDTILMQLMGGQLSGLLVARLLFSLIWVYLFVRIVRRLPPRIWERWLIRPHSPRRQTRVIAH
jgi:hypothetical protein